MEDSRRIYTKDILIPIITAFTAVAINQFFLYYNKNTEAKVEYELGRLKEQAPVLNRILWFALTNSRDANESLIITQKYNRKYSINASGDTLFQKKEIIKVDTAKYYIPYFLTDSLVNSKFKDDLDYIKKIETC